MPTTLWTRLKAAWLRFIPLAEAADNRINRLIDFATDVIKSAADKAQERRKNKKLPFALPVTSLDPSPAVVRQDEATPLPAPKSDTRLLFEQASAENATLTELNRRLQEDNDQLRAQLQEAQRLLAPRRSITRLLFGEASDENVKLRQERDGLVKERDRLRGENQTLQARLAHFTETDDELTRNSFLRRAEARLQDVLGFFLPNVVMVDGTAGFLLMELDHLNRVLDLLRNPTLLRGHRTGSGWLEYKFGKGSLYAVRLYYRHDDETGKYEVLLSKKQLQERDFERLGRM